MRGENIFKEREEGRLPDRWKMGENSRVYEVGAKRLIRSSYFHCLHYLRF